MRKEETACNKQFLLFSQCFLRYMALIFYIKCSLKCSLQFVSIWTSLICCCLVMGYGNNLNTFVGGWGRGGGTFPQQTKKPDDSREAPTQGILNPFPHNDTFWRVWERSLLKTLWEMEKLLIQAILGKGEIACTSNFSFSHNVFYSIKGRDYHFCYIQFVVCKCFQFGLVQISSCGNELIATLNDWATQEWQDS